LVGSLGITIDTHFINIPIIELMNNFYHPTVDTNPFGFAENSLLMNDGLLIMIFKLQIYSLDVIWIIWEIQYLNRDEYFYN